MQKNTEKLLVEENLRGYIKRFCDEQIDKEATDLLIMGIMTCEDKITLCQYFQGKLGIVEGQELYNAVEGHFLNLKKIAA